MSLKRIFFNILLAVIVALPLAATESRFNVERPDYFLQEENTLNDNWMDDVAMNNEASQIVELVSDKTDRHLVRPRARSRYDEYINSTSEAHGVSPALVKAVIKTESNFNPNVVSPVGAVGLMQVLPSTARRVGVSNPHSPEANILAGVKYLKRLLDMFDGDEALAVAAYNSGPSKVLKYGGVPPYKETKVFVARVMAYYRAYLNS